MAKSLKLFAALIFIIGGLLFFNTVVVLINAGQLLALPITIKVYSSVEPQVQRVSFTGVSCSVLLKQRSGNVWIYEETGKLAQRIIVSPAYAAKEIFIAKRERSFIPRFNRTLNWAGDRELLKQILSRTLCIFFLAVIILGIRAAGRKYKWRIDDSIFINLFVTLIFFSAIMTGANFDFAGDDGFFFRQPFTLQYLIQRYLSWSGRIPIETLLVFLTKQSIWLWRILNSLVFMLFLWSIEQFISLPGMNKTTGSKLKICFLALLPLFLLSLNVFREVFTWVPGSLNYFWVISFGLLALLPFKKYLYGEKISKGLGFSSAAAIFYAAYTEQMVLVLLFFILAVLTYVYLTRKAFSWQLLFSALLVCLNGLILFLAPGNLKRFAYEAARYPGFLNLSLTEKFLQGYAYLLDHIWVRLFPGFKSLFAMPFIFSSKNIWLLFILSIINFIVFYLILVIAEKRETKLMISILYPAAFAVTILLGFSPTIFNSGDRIFFMAEMIFGIILSLLLYPRLLNLSKRRK